LLCNHTLSHDYGLAFRDDATQRAEIGGGLTANRAAEPDAAVPFFRAPGGNFSPRAGGRGTVVRHGVARLERRPQGLDDSRSACHRNRGRRRRATRLDRGTSRRGPQPRRNRRCTGRDHRRSPGRGIPVRDPGIVTKPYAVIDLDGVLADVSARLHHIEGNPQELERILRWHPARPSVCRGFCRRQGACGGTRTGLSERAARPDPLRHRGLAAPARRAR
jgi:hypothetical protein